MITLNIFGNAIPKNGCGWRKTTRTKNNSNRKRRIYNVKFYEMELGVLVGVLVGPKIVSYAKIVHAAIWSETEVNGATKRLRCTEWRPNSVGRGGTAVLCCPRVGHWETCRLQSLVLGLFVSVHFHSTLTENSSLLSAPSAKRNRKLLKLTLSFYSDLDYQTSSDVLHTTKFQQSLTLRLCVIFFSC